MGRTPAVAARDLAYRYPTGRTGVEPLSLDVFPGERVVVMGPNGAGKSTLLRLLAAEMRPGGGTLRLLGEAPHARGLRRRIGVAGDRPVHLDALPGLDNALLFARAAGLSAAEASRRVPPVLDAFHLTPVAHVPVAEYSLGMRRKLLLAEALVPEPELLLLDEPTLGLDPPAVDVLAELVGASAGRGAGTVVATNDVAAAPRLADRILFLDEGRLVADASPEELMGRTTGGITVELTLAGPVPVDDLARSLPDAEVTSTGDRLLVRLPGGAERLPAVVEALVARGVGIRDMAVREPHLGDAFRALTGRPLPERAGGPEAGP